MIEDELFIGRVDERTLEFIRLLLRGEGNSGNGQFTVQVRGRRIIGLQALVRVGGPAAFPGKEINLVGKKSER
jgi:hypothetical protein